MDAKGEPQAGLRCARSTRCLVERAGFKELAKKYYQDFERIHKETKDKRYDGLAQWAARQRAALKSVGPTVEEKASVDMLVLRRRN